MRELAEQFKVTPGAISAAFKRTGVTRRAAPPGPRARRKSRVDAEALPPEPGESSDSARPGSKDALILPFKGKLGNVPDAEVADEAGVSVRTIASFRARNGIAGYTGPRRRRKKGGGRRSKIDAFAELLGQVPDRVVAEKAGVTLNAVRNYRAKRGIQAAGRAATPMPQVAHATAITLRDSAADDGAWRVTTENGGSQAVRVVVAGSLAEAANRAEAAGLGQIVSLEWIGSVV
ncbi:MAG: hypothetical protein KTR31_26120 [Myxococcales bacterium]|nr:hypothetical protein [Myxococcales bacterium]